ncbi:hypothetical protein [Nitrososphaera sp. AFS]|uniref:hypothetical protein n=1 Tax=Nitrososphaera sp. AFS TaxID=2301191 RepID=UPI0013924953|nr:hypothetical protein [Nitrososphaera sp. AFS]NAL78064.1 hypothetical protein [Nitrososphaera sp. AFS]
MSNSSSEEDKEITERIIRTEPQLREINKDFKQIDNTIDKNHKLSEPIMQLQSQIMRLETDLAETDKTINSINNQQEER